MSKLRSLALWIIACSFLVPCLAHANGLSAMTGRSVIHLFFLNLIIGTGEGILLALVLQGFCASSFAACVGIMIVANYFSAFTTLIAVGLAMDRWQGDLWQWLTIHEIPRIVRWVVYTAYLSTIVLEWPFCSAALVVSQRREKRRAKSLALAPPRIQTVRQLIYGLCLSAMVQTVSYPVLFLYYAQRGEHFPSVNVQNNLDFAYNKDALVYYISRQDGDVYRVPLGGGQPKKECKVSIGNPWLLSLEPAHKAQTVWVPFPSGRRKYPNIRELHGVVWDMWIYSPNHANPQLILHSVANSNNSIVGTCEPSTALELDATGEGTPGSSGSLEGSRWVVRTGDGGSLVVHDPKTGHWLHFEFELPFGIAWRVQHRPILLPGDQVLYQLGDQIVLLDLQSHKMGLVALGGSPVVVIPNRKTRGD